MMWWWDNFFFFRTRGFLTSFNKMDVNNSQCNGKKKISMEMSPPQSVQNFSMKPLTHSSWFHLSFVHFEVIFMVDEGKDHDKLFST